MKGKNKRVLHSPKSVNIIIVVLLIFFGAMAAYGGWKLTVERKEYRTGTDTYEYLVEAVNKTTTSDAEQSNEGQEIEEFSPSSVDFDTLQKINSQSVAWINGCDNVINYPVVQGENNEYYLNHLVDGTVNRSGSIFVDSRNKPGFSDRNTFIYGHNMINGTMFSAIGGYIDQSYYDKYPTLTLVTPEGSYSLQAFSGYVTPGTSDTYRIEYADDTAFAEYLDHISRKSNFASDVKVTSKDKIVTLSTCTYDYDDARYVLHCKLVPMQE